MILPLVPRMKVCGPTADILPARRMPPPGARDASVRFFLLSGRRREGGGSLH